MNWKLILQLSLFGLAMAFATVFFIPSKVEPLVWLAIFIACAYVIATKAPGKSFLAQDRRPPIAGGSLSFASCR